MREALAQSRRQQVAQSILAGDRAPTPDAVARVHGGRTLQRQRQSFAQVISQVRGKESAETGGSIGRNVLLGLIGVDMLLALQFPGYLAPITVMTVIPAALIGVVVNDSILLVFLIRRASVRGDTIALLPCRLR